jgi:hypothetical protein
MNGESVAPPPLSKGDIIEFLEKKNGIFWGIYLGWNWVVYVLPKSNGSCQRKSRFLMDYIWRPESTVNIGEIENLVESLIFYRINNSVNSHWNLLIKPANPEKIAERALEQIGLKTPLTSEEFVMHCRNGNTIQFIQWIIATYLASILLRLARAQESVASVLTEHHFNVVAFMYLLLFSSCFVISILRKTPRKPKSEQNT